MLNVVNRPKVSRFVAGTYVAFAVFIVAVIAFFVYSSFFTPMGILGLAAVLVAICVEAVMLLVLLSIYGTRYILADERLIIKTTRLIGGSKQVRLGDIGSVERVLIPFGIRLFGASFHGGYYHIPRLGKAFMVITNFNDGILVKTKHGNYIITPEKPEEFIKTNKNAMKNVREPIVRNRQT